MIASDVTLHDGVVIYHPELVNLYGCIVEAGTRIGTFVEIQKKAAVGKIARSPAIPSSARE